MFYSISHWLLAVQCHKLLFQRIQRCPAQMSKMREESFLFELSLTDDHYMLDSQAADKLSQINWLVLKCTVFIWNRIWNRIWNNCRFSQELEFRIMEIFENFTLPLSQNSSGILLAVIIETVFFIRLIIELEKSEIYNSRNSLNVFLNIFSVLIINQNPCKTRTCASLFPKSLLRVVT